MLDFVAITDHNATNGAESLKNNLGDQAIVGEEINTTAGDIVGLYLQTSIPAGLSLQKAIQAIKEQGGLVYIPHPLEKFRRGLQKKELEQFKKDFDIIEVFNARSRSRLYAELARHFAQNNNIAMVSSSDAHGARGIGSAYVEIAEAPTRENLLQLLRQGNLVCHYAPVSAYFYPTINKVRKYFKRNNV